MQPTVLVTGGFGFLGRAVARAYRGRGYRVVGLGHARWTAPEASAHGFDFWRTGDVRLQELETLNERFDVVVHCAANSSVPYSLDHPLEAFQRTVQSTAELLEYLRRSGSKPLVIYPSSAAVYGATEDRPLCESDTPNPVSPYGHHKQMTEELLACYARYFGLRAVVIRFFSVYGPGLAKQLLWDAASKLSSGAHEVSFWGTGDETRDWIHIDDAATLVAALSESKQQFLVVNGANGERITVATVLQLLRTALGVDVAIHFNGVIKPGDPRHYHADMTRASALGWQPRVPLTQGLQEYVEWFRRPSSVDGRPAPSESVKKK
jgi:UDP-glucose 4-epimerase